MSDKEEALSVEFRTKKCVRDSIEETTHELHREFNSMNSKVDVLMEQRIEELKEELCELLAKQIKQNL